MKFSLLPLVAAISMTSLARAADTELDTVTVTASRVAEPLSQALSSVTVINREALDRYPSHDLPEVLRFEAGLNVVRLGGLGGQTSIFTRGTESNHTLVMVDGIRINPSTSSIANIQNISLTDVDRIEIVKGSLSSLYGSDAIGGVINIITKNPEKTATRISVTAGSDKLAKGNVTQTLNSGAFSALLDVNALYTDGYDIIENLSLPRGQKSEGGGIKLNAKIGNTTLGVQGRLNRGTTEYYNFGTPATQDFLNETVGFMIDSQLGERFGTRLRISQMRDEINQNESPSIAQTEELEIDWQNTWQAADRLSYVIGATTTKTEANYDNNFGTTFSEDNKKYGIYLQQRLGIGAFDTQIAARRDDHDSFGVIYTGNIGLGYAIDRNNRLYANAGTGYHAPDLNDLYGFGGNPLLESEKSVTREVGSRHQVGNTTWTVAFFRNDIRSLITTDCDPLPPYTCTNINVDKATIRGTELGFRWANEGWFLGLTGNYTRAIDDTTKSELLRRPRRSLIAETGYGESRWGTSIQTQSSGRSIDAGSRRAPGYTVVNAQAWWQAMSQLRLQINIDNAGDKAYGQAYQAANTLYLSAPLSTYLTATLNF